MLQGRLRREVYAVSPQRLTDQPALILARASSRFLALRANIRKRAQVSKQLGNKARSSIRGERIVRELTPIGGLERASETKKSFG